MLKRFRKQIDEYDMNIRNEMKNWFDTHSKRANHALFKKIKSDPEKWNVILMETKFLPTDSPDQRRLWHYYNGVFEIPQCAICGKELRYVNFSGPYLETCSKKCATTKKWQDGKMDDCRDKRTESFKSKWGVGAVGHEDLLKKRRETSLQRYGAIHHMKSEEWYSKYQAGIESKYGVSNVAKVPAVIEKIKETWKTMDDTKALINKNRVVAMNEKYGVDSAFSLKSTRDKIKKGNLEKYGVEYLFQLQEFQDGMKLKMKEKYGETNPSLVPELKDKKKQTMVNSKRWIADEDLSEWGLYKKDVTRRTRKTLLDFGDKKFGIDWRDKIGKMGVDEGMQIDHIFSIKHGYDNGVAPEVISNITNLQMVTWEENIEKSVKSGITLDELTSLTQK